MALFGGEKARKEESEALYSQKYPLSDNISSIQSSLNLANVELVGLKNQQPSTSGGKRIRQRNITALTNRIMQLKNKIKDLQSGMSGSDILKITAPTLATLPKVTTQQILNTTPYSFQIPNVSLPKTSVDKILVTPKYQVKTEDVADLAEGIENQSGLPVDGEAMGAQGDYPPPQGVQDNTKKTVLLYGSLALVVAITAFYLFKKKK